MDFNETSFRHCYSLVGSHSKACKLNERLILKISILYRTGATDF